MMGSLFSSISGLRIHTTWMNTIGNNISNVNTVGYKYQRITFKEQIAQSMGSASGADLASNIGGKNPMQMGLGGTLGSIDTIMTQGAIQTTGNALDVALQGDGFFAVKQGATTYYTRAGNFLQDNKGNLVTSSGMIVQGWMGTLERTINDTPGVVENPEVQIRSATYKIDTSDVSKIGNITIPKDLRMAAQMTGYIKFAGNLDSNTPVNNYCSTAVVPVGTPTVLPSNYSPSGFSSVIGGAVAAQGTPWADPNNPLPPGSNPGVRNALNNTCFFFHVDPANPNSAKVTPDHTATMTVYDALGNPRNITFWFFQHGVDPTATGVARPVWDWYAFDTTYVQGSTIYTGEPDYFNCIAGTNISQVVDPAGGGYPAGGLAAVTAQFANTVWSPIWFNQDGSIANNGSMWGIGGAGPFNTYAMVSASKTGSDGVVHYGPEIFFDQLPNAQGLTPDGAATPWSIILDFGTPNSWDFTTAGNAVGSADGVLRVNVANNTPINPALPGLRDGVTGDVTGSYQIIGGVSTYVPNSTAYGKEQDGYQSGDLIGLSVDSVGGIVGQFTNEKSITIAKIAVATFLNPQGLAKAGDSLYSITSNSGTARMNVAGAAGAATTVGGALEASNVDLAVELTNMILAQRGFESNARVITTSADMLNTLVNIGR
jgi:flagellar hook protein FlgE